MVKILHCEDFIYRVINDGLRPFIEIRGSAFEHTSIRELYLNDKIEQLLKSNCYKIQKNCCHSSKI